MPPWWRVSAALGDNEDIASSFPVDENETTDGRLLKPWGMSPGDRACVLPGVASCRRVHPGARVNNNTMHYIG